MNASIDNAESLAGGYLAMARVFSYPSADVWHYLTEHGMVAPDLTREELEDEYLAAFEIGRDGVLAPLFEGLNRPERGREGILEDLMRFYEFFDVRLNEADREYPDHLATELEFLAWLCVREQAAERRGGDTEPFRRAARDFLDRHTGAWLPELQRRLEATGSAYGEYSDILAELVRQHRARLNQQHNGSEA